MFGNLFLINNKMLRWTDGIKTLPSSARTWKATKETLYSLRRRVMTIEMFRGFKALIPRRKVDMEKEMFISGVAQWGTFMGLQQREGGLRDRGI